MLNDAKRDEWLRDFGKYLEREWRMELYVDAKLAAHERKAKRRLAKREESA